ncbi:BON domain-containing protein [Leptolyngbya sp. 'hensonii']|uniref:BON domain-containing protein n=1 Tax=Leptolyngbya sp. 'hensonii' TaxID=1922337 RepID=UPI000B0643CE|nr:BON domain-containing protein [Leptolyngbya sp. 'hensonii']
MEFVHQPVQWESFPKVGTPLTGVLPEQPIWTPLFTAIPPERVGLNGEYDYEGLAKRVAAQLHQSLKAEDICDLQVLQRGKVVILKGIVPNEIVLQQVIEVASQVSGATAVEIGRVAFPNA